METHPPDPHRLGTGRCGEPGVPPTSSPQADDRAARNTVAITEQSGSAAVHRVEDAQIAEMAAGNEPRAVCGEVFTPAALCAPEGVPCPRCVEALRRRDDEASQPAARRRFWAVWR